MASSTVPPWVWAAGAAAAVLLLPKAVSAAVPSLPADPNRKPSGGSGRTDVSPLSASKIQPFLPVVRRAVARHTEYSWGRVGAGDESLLIGLLWHESRFDPAAVSWTGAAGIGQFTGIGRAEVRRLMTLSQWSDRYAGEAGLATRLKYFQKADAFVADICIEASALLLASLIRKWSGNVEAALTDYNAGGTAAGIVSRYGSHAAAKQALVDLPDNQRSQSPVYAPTVLADAAKYDAGMIA